MSTLQVRPSGYRSARGKQSQSGCPRGPARLLWRHRDPAHRCSGLSLHPTGVPATCRCQPCSEGPRHGAGVSSLGGFLAVGMAW